MNFWKFLKIRGGAIKWRGQLNEEYGNNKIYPNLCTDKLQSAPLSGYLLNSHKCCYVIQMSHIKGFLYLDNNFCHFFQNIYDENTINENKKKKKEKDDDFDEEKKMCYGYHRKFHR